MTTRSEIVTLSRILEWYSEDQEGMKVPSISGSEVSRLYQIKSPSPRKPETVHRIGNKEEALVVLADFPHFQGYREALTTGLTPKQFQDVLDYERPEVSLSPHFNLGEKHHLEMGENEGLRELAYEAMVGVYRMGFKLGEHRLEILERSK